MKKTIKSTFLFFCLIFFLLSLSTGCNSNQHNLMEILFCTDARPLRFTSRYRSTSFSYDSLSSYLNLYPELNLSQMKWLPVYKYIEDIDSLYERTAGFADKLLMDISKMTDKSDDYSEQVSYIGNDDDVYYNLYASENSVNLYAEKMYYNFDSDTVDTQIGSYPLTLEYEVTECGFVLPEDTVQLYKNNCQELLKKLHKEDYTDSDINISIHPYMDDTDYLKNNDYTITITLSYYPPKSGDCSDALLEFYSLDSHISLDIIYFSKSGFRSAKIREYSSDWLKEIGQFEITPYSEAQICFDNDDNVRYGNDDYAHDPASDIPDETWDYYVNADIVKNYNMYLVYVKDKEGYIRPLYMKQDYYKVGRMEGAAWIDAIDY